MRLAALLLLAGAMAFAQELESDTITVMATQRLVFNQPDGFALSLYVTSNGTTGLDDLQAALPGVGLSAENLTNVYGGGDGGLRWVFNVRLPLSRLGPTVRALASYSGSDLSLQYQVWGAVSSTSQAARPCVLTTLMADARTQAEKTAGAAGLRVGAVVQFTDATAPVGIPTNIAPVATYGYVAGGGLISGAPVVDSRVTTCAAIVQFKLLR